MEPTVIIPTYWARRRSRGNGRSLSPFDHPTPVGEAGTLPECLESLRKVKDLGRVVVIVAAADESTALRAEDLVQELLAGMPDMDAIVFGTAEMGSLNRRLEQIEFVDAMEGVNLKSYGSVRNTGLAVAAVLGSQAVVFLDDDEVVVDPDFLQRGMEGVGEAAVRGRPLLAKTGYYLGESGGIAMAPATSWHDKFWPQDESFNSAMATVLEPPRIKPATFAFGGCLALHRDMYCNVPFDPWAVRGEDVDYVIDVRMHGGDVFLDNEWSVVHKPPKPSSEAAVFRHDVFRFIYTHRKLEFAESQVDLRQVKPASLMPYPGRLVDASVGWRARTTAILRALAGKERGAYLRIARESVSEAERYARDNCERYFAFQRRWPMLMDRLWEDVALKPLFTGERHVDRTALTGRFPVVRSDRPT